MSGGRVEGHVRQPRTPEERFPIVAMEVATVQRCAVASGKNPRITDTVVRIVFPQGLHGHPGKPKSTVASRGLGNINLALEHGSLDRELVSRHVQVGPP